MAQHDYIISNGTGAAVRSDLNGALGATVSNNSGATEPATMYAYQWWADTTSGFLKQRNSANSAWITIGTLGSANLGLLSLAGGTMTGVLAAAAGTAALPGIAFTGDLDTGLSAATANTIVLSTNATARQTISTTAISAALPVDVPLGAAATPSLTFTGDLDSGVFSSGANAVDITTGGTRRLGISSAGDLTVYGGNFTLNAQGDLRFADSDSSNYIAIQAPATITSNLTFTLPSVDGTNGQVLSTNGTGTLSFASVASDFAGTSDVNGVNTTGTVTASTTSLVVASATGIAAGMFVVGEGIAPGTTVSSIASTTVTLSANANTTLSADPVTFYSASKILTPAVVGSQLCRAWVNFNGTGTVAIRASFNVSSITDNGVGDYTVYFTTAMVDANYCYKIQSQLNASISDTNTYNPTSGTIAAGSINVRTWSDNTVQDNAIVCVAVFR